MADVRDSYMAIQLLFNFIVARQFEIDAKYPGGWAKFKSDWVTNPERKPGLADEHLVAYSSMGSDDSDVFAELARFQISVAAGSAGAGSDPAVDWLETGVLNEGSIGWLKGTEPGEVAWFNSRSRYETGMKGHSNHPKWWQFWR